MTANVRTGRGITEFTDAKHQSVDQDQDQDLRLTDCTQTHTHTHTHTHTRPEGPMASREGEKPSEMSLGAQRRPAVPLEAEIGMLVAHGQGRS